MSNKRKKLITKMEKQEYIVIRVTKTEFELDNGDTYPHAFELDDDITVEQFQKILDDSKDTVLDHIKKIDDTDKDIDE